MAFMDSGISVYLRKFDAQGRDLGEELYVLKESKKSGVYLINASGFKQITLKTFAPTQVTVFRESDVASKSVVGRAAVGYLIAGPLGGVVGGISGTGKKDAWYLEILEEDGTATVFRTRNEADARAMEKRIMKHISA